MTRRPRVVRVLPSLDFGGAENSAMRMLAALDEREFESHLVLLGDEIGPAVTVPEHVTVHRIARRIERSLPALVGTLRRLEPDVVWSGIIHANILAALAHRVGRCSAPLVLTEHGMPSTAEAESASRRRATLWLMRRAYPRATIVTAVSEAVAHYLRGEMPGMADRVVMVPNPAVPDDPAGPLSRPTGITWLDAPDGPVIVAAGRLSQAKRYDVMIRTFALLAGRDERLRLVILGEGPLRPQIEAQIAAAGLGDRVVLAGYHRDPRACMARAAVFLHTADTEAFGNVLVEALSCGVPVVCADASGGIREAAGRPPVGWVVELDPATLAEAVIEAMAAPPATEARREHARPYSVASGIAANLEVLHRALAARGRRGAGRGLPSSGLA